MSVIALDATALILVGFGALLAGFTTGLTGFGTGLVASGVWFHVLPPETVPPLVALSSVAWRAMRQLMWCSTLSWSRKAAITCWRPREHEIERHFTGAKL